MQSELARTPADVAVELVPILYRLRRLVRQRMQAEVGASPLPEAQLELIRLVRAASGLRVQEVAERLRVAPNTVSTLVRQLERSGFLERRTDPRDGRVVRLHLTAGGRARIARWRDRRQAIVASALDSLSEADRRDIGAALPALLRLVEVLDS